MRALPPGPQCSRSGWRRKETPNPTRKPKMQPGIPKFSQSLEIQPGVPSGALPKLREQHAPFPRKISREDKGKPCRHLGCGHFRPLSQPGGIGALPDRAQELAQIRSNRPKIHLGNPKIHPGEHSESLHRHSQRIAPSSLSSSREITPDTSPPSWRRLLAAPSAASPLSFQISRYFA